VAVKTLHEELSKEHYQRRLFEKEVAVCSRLHHPNIAAICGVIQEEGAPFSLIIELLQASLADVIEAAHVSGKYLTLREQTDVSHDCLSGLTYLHELVGVQLFYYSLIVVSRSTYSHYLFSTGTSVPQIF
jgi:serine/threonine protein kinase